MDYNTQLSNLIIPEYGRNIQIMIEHCITIKNRNERNTCAKAIIQVMGQLNPHLRDISDFTHKLWDHLFIISQFKLDVDSPYPMPNRETFDTKPKSVTYPPTGIKFKHYGKMIEYIIEKAKKYPEGDEKKELTRLIANHLKKSFINWNKDSVTDDIIFKQFNILTNNEIALDETMVLAQTHELKNKQYNNQTPISLGLGSKNKNKYKKKKKNNFQQNNNNNNKPQPQATIKP